MATAGTLLLAAAGVLVAYTFIGYPALLAVGAPFVRARPPARPPHRSAEELPYLTITVPAHNEVEQIRDTLESLLALDYPPSRRQILVVSDASTDGTDEVVREYEGRGVELLRREQREGKTAAENAARERVRGELVLNTDASVRIEPSAPRQLVARFADPGVGVASGRDVSVARGEGDANAGESGYVGYEMWVRDLESRLGGIVGASGCLYVIRGELHARPLPPGLSRDFAAALVAHEHGYRSVSVKEAVCFVPRAPSLHREFGRKVRTITRGMSTLLHKRGLLNPFAHPLFAWKLVSHKVCRWLVPWSGVSAVAGLLLLAPDSTWAQAGLVASGSAVLLGLAGWYWPPGRPVPRILSVPAYLGAGVTAVLVATFRTLTGAIDPVWEPTRREAAERADAGHRVG